MISSNNCFYIEKFNAIPGIYMIYNLNRKTIYVGQARDLKERMRTHIMDLYINHSDNKNLQDEFNDGNNKYIYRLLEKIDNTISGKSLKNTLNKYESLYFQAAQKLFSHKNVHNIQNLNKIYEPSDDALNIAINVIKERLKEINGPTLKIECEEDVRRKLNKDILDKYNEDIISNAQNELVRLTEKTTNKSSTSSNRTIKLDEISIKDLYDEGKLKHLFVGKMGDYIGNGQSQSFTDILSEKLAYIAYKGKCLWATAGPDVEEAHSFIQKYGFDYDEKKMYALFPLTSSKYTNDNELTYYYWYDCNGERLEDTAPKVSTNRKKALVINKFWTVKEDFNLNRFLDGFYRHQRAAIDSKTQKPILNSNVDSISQLPLCCITSKKEILEKIEFQKELGLNNELVEKLQSSIPQEDIRFYETNGETYYILAEISDYVYIRSDI